MGFAKVGLKNMFWALANSIELLYFGWAVVILPPPFSPIRQRYGQTGRVLCETDCLICYSSISKKYCLIILDFWFSTSFVRKVLRKLLYSYFGALFTYAIKDNSKRQNWIKSCFVILYSINYDSRISNLSSVQNSTLSSSYNSTKSSR